MDLFTSLLVKAFSGIFYVIYWLAFRIIRIAWWLSLYLLLTLGAGMIWLARGGKGRPVDTGGFGRHSEDEALWQDHATGTVYPVSATDLEYCEVVAELGGQYWRRTMLNRLLRRGALWRYKFSAVTADGRKEVAAWCEFPSEAWKGITLDHLAPTGGVPVSGIDPDALEYNRGEARAALEHLEALLKGRGWQPHEDPGDPPPDHWYGSRFRRKVITWDAPLAPAIPAEEAVRQSSEQAAAEEAALQDGN
jgi:hypothetical protein